MPTFGCSQIDVHLWTNCLAEVSDAMLAAGWNKHARKFTEVRLRKARKLYRIKSG